MNEAQYMLSIGLKPEPLKREGGVALPAYISPNYAMVENGDPDGLVRARDHNNEYVPNSRRSRKWL